MFLNEVPSQHPQTGLAAGPEGVNTIPGIPSQLQHSLVQGTWQSWDLLWLSGRALECCKTGE